MRIYNFDIEDIDGCEFVKDSDVGKIMISYHYDFDGYPTGVIHVVYSDGSQTTTTPEEAQKNFDNEKWHVIR